MTETPIYYDALKALEAPPAPARPHIRKHTVVNGRRVTPVDPTTPFKRSRVEVDLTTPARPRAIPKSKRTKSANRTSSKRALAGSRRNKKHPIARKPTLRDRGWELDWDA